MSIRIAGTGCSLIDVLYADIDFSTKGFKEYSSKKDGDGGLSPGKLVFTEEFEQFCGKSFGNVLDNITGGGVPATENLGGPSIVALIHASQILAGRDISVEFHGARGADRFGDTITAILGKTPVEISGYTVKPGVTPTTTVLSDPRFNDGHGERIFINNIGAAWNYYPSDLADSFFDADIIIFGGTGLVPRIHDNLTALVKKAKDKGRVTVATTVYDFRNEKRNPGGKWPLGESEETFRYTDLFIADYEEALKISGCPDIDAAASYYTNKGVGAFIVTHGPEDIHLYSRGVLFAPLSKRTMPVSKRIGSEIRTAGKARGDTTGCGDNFAGGVIASIASQLSRLPRGKPDLALACAWGVASGGFAAFYVGGTYVEKNPGEKYRKILPYLEDYADQIGLPLPCNL